MNKKLILSVSGLLTVAFICDAGAANLRKGPYLCYLGNGQSQAVQFPGQTPGKAQVKVTNEQIRFENNVLFCSWAVSDGRLMPIEFTDKISSTKLNLKGSQCFKIIDANEGKINCCDLKIVGKPKIKTIEPNLRAARLVEHFTGKAVSVELASTDGNLKVNWTAILRDESNYIHQRINFRAKKRQIPIKSIVLIDIPCDDARIAGTVPGSPAVCGNMFFAYEHPNSQSQIVRAASKNSKNRVLCRLTRNSPLKPDKPLSQSSVFGVVPAGQLRRGFLYYIERQRAHPYRPFLHYNSWWDISWHGLKMNEKQCLDVIDYYGKELAEKRGVKLDSFVFDDGWDDNTTLWQILKSNFPNGFTHLTKLAQKYNSHIGLWLSPWGGYHDDQKQRIKYGEKQDFEINECAYSLGTGRDYRGFSLAGKKYYKHFKQRCLDMMEEYNVNFFKFDGTTATLLEESEAMLNLCGELRKVNPDLYISITAGTWASAFWLMHGDNTWRGGHDMSYCGKGTQREQWITYRDSITYENVVQKGPLYPINSLMICGIINVPNGDPNQMETSGPDFIDEIRSFFATGTNLQELYIKPSHLTQRALDTIAESAKWSRANSDVFVDTHWVGGDPNQLQIYGWAAWSPRKGILSLRNPNNKPQQINIDIAKVFELTDGSTKQYSLKSPWRQDAGKPSITLTAGVEHTFRLEPFEVLVFDALPGLCARNYYVSPAGVLDLDFVSFPFHQALK